MRYLISLIFIITFNFTCYSARYYGARGGRKKKNKAENEPVDSNAI